jgi:hypothetical protein
MSTPSSFWETVSTYCSHLAPVTGPLLAALGDTADALDNASRRTPAPRRFDPTVPDPRLLRAVYTPEPE